MWLSATGLDASTSSRLTAPSFRLKPVGFGAGVSSSGSDDRSSSSPAPSFATTSSRGVCFSATGFDASTSSRFTPPKLSLKPVGFAAGTSSSGSDERSSESPPAAAAAAFAATSSRGVCLSATGLDASTASRLRVLKLSLKPVAAAGGGSSSGSDERSSSPSAAAGGRPGGRPAGGLCARAVTLPRMCGVGLSRSSSVAGAGAASPSPSEPRGVTSLEIHSIAQMPAASAASGRGDESEPRWLAQLAERSLQRCRRTK